MMFIKLFQELSKKDIAFAGGKGASLGEMTQVNLPVPPRFVILSSAFERFSDETNINVEIDAKLHTVDKNIIHTVEEASQKIQAIILQTKIPQDIAEEIQKEFKNLGSKYVAVRSSATVEDGFTAAWAGQLDSFLNVTKENLLENVRQCWASLFTPQAIFYRFEKNFHKQKISVAVVVQKMVESEKSGIVFSVHPVTQDRNQIIIEAGYGLGEAIVSGSITPDAYVVEKEPRRIIDKNINTQERMLARAKDGGDEWQSISKEKRKKSVLDDKQIMELTNLVLKIETHYKFPQDIEWAFEKGKFYIVQSRPITTLRDVNNKNDDIIKFIKNHKFYKQLTHPFMPVIYFESIMKSYDNNPLQEKLNIKKLPNVIEVLRNKFEGWDDQNIQKITNRKEIKLVIDQGRKTMKQYNGLIKILLQQNYLKLKNDEFAEAVKLLDGICTEIYQTYIYFIHEFFETDDKDLVKLLPEVRMELSGFVDKIYECCVAFVENLDKRFKDVSETVLWHSSFEDLIFLLKNPGSIKNFKKRMRGKKESIVFVYDNNQLHIIKNQKQIERIISILEERKEKINVVNKITGNIVFRGKSKGRVVKLLEKDYPNAKGILSGKKNYILVTPMTRPKIVPYMKKATAFITDEGGITCHAAIVSRELKKPCIVGTKIATQVLKDGDLVEVDAEKGTVKIIS